MRPRWMLTALALAVPAQAVAQSQEQQARAPAVSAQQQPAPPVYDMVAGDRETAWRINRVTGEIVICRVDTTGSLDSARARCSPAAFETMPQQSLAPPGGGRP